MVILILLDYSGTIQEPLPIEWCHSHLGVVFLPHLTTFRNSLQDIMLEICLLVNSRSCTLTISIKYLCWLALIVNVTHLESPGKSLNEELSRVGCVCGFICKIWAYQVDILDKGKKAAVFFTKISQE